MTLQAKKLYKIRLRHAKFISTLIMLQPFTRAVVLNGSLTNGVTSTNSDIDLLIITSNGRIFTARLFCSLAVWLTGLKRSSNENANHAGRVCLNYYLTEGFLIIPHHRSEEINRYCAENYSKSVLIAGDEAVFKKFLSMNRWMEKYIEGTNTEIIHRKKIGKKQFSNLAMSRSACGGKQFFESILSGKFGQRVERYLKRVQLARIGRDPRAKSYPDLIWADDREMRFHPPKKRI